MKLWVAILANRMLSSEQPMSISWIKVSVYLPHWSNGLYLCSPLKRSKPLQHSPGQQVSQVTQYRHTCCPGREEVKTQNKDISESLFQSFFHKVSCFQTEILKSWQKSSVHLHLCLQLSWDWEWAVSTKAINDPTLGSESMKSWRRCSLRSQCEEAVFPYTSIQPKKQAKGFWQKQESPPSGYWDKCVFLAFLWLSASDLEVSSIFQNIDVQYQVFPCHFGMGWNL